MGLKRPCIDCQFCRGSGRRVLPQPYWLTLRLVTRSWSTTDEILVAHMSWALERTALINRLNKLVAFGLVGRRQRPGKKHLEWRRES